jgi:hypothetical protein
LTAGIREVFSNAGYEHMLDIPRNKFPGQFFIIDYPICEKRNILAQCMFGHELSHILYSRYQLSDRLLSVVTLNEGQIEVLINTYAMQPIQGSGGKDETTTGDILPRWRIEHTVRRKLNTILEKWVQELTADALALCLFGPAYFFAFTYFAGPYASMCDSSESHPPDRMRIELMYDMLFSGRSGLAYEQVLDEITNNYIEQWELYAKQAHSATQNTGSHFHDVVIQAIRPLFADIIREAKKVTRGKRYEAQIFGGDIAKLCDDHLAHGFPPNEVIDYTTGESRIVDSESILNAGWIYLISGDEKFSKLINADDRWEIKNKFYDLVSKGLEYAEIQRQWDSVS